MGARFVATQGGAGKTKNILGGRFTINKGVIELPDDASAELITNMTKVLGETFACFPEHEVRAGRHGHVPGFFDGKQHSEPEGPTGGPDGPDSSGPQQPGKPRK